MSLDTYAHLQTAVAGWLKRDDLTSNIPDFITLYEAQMNRELMNMEPPHYSLITNQQTTFVNTGSAPFQIALPAGYKGTKRFQIKQSGNYRTLTYKTPQQIAQYQTSGQPNFYTIIGNNIEVATTPDTNYSYNWDYFSPLATISGGANNWMMTNSPDMYLYGALLHSAPFLKNDARLQTWGTLYAKCLDDLEQNNRKYHYSGSILQQRSDSAI